nr:MAG TPA: hypothetical protein [Caudoviricetes sp.]
MPINKVSGRCVTTFPTGTARVRPLFVTRLWFHVFAPPGASRTGPLFYLKPGRSPEHKTKERQQRQDDEASHAANLLYPQAGVCAVPSARRCRVTKKIYSKAM